MATVIDVPAPGRKWVTGALVRDGLTLYRVTGRPVRYHEDCLPMQRVAKVRQPPEGWTGLCRLLAIMEEVRVRGTHTPGFRGAIPNQPGEECPRADGRECLRWTAQEDEMSSASYPRIEVRGDILRFVRPLYDDAPIITWLHSADLASEARALIGRSPSLTRYPHVRVR